MTSRWLRHPPRALSKLRSGMTVADAAVLQALRDGRTARLRAGPRATTEHAQSGDLLVVAGSRPEVGDIAVCWHERSWIAHRVEKAEPGRLLLHSSGGQPRWVPVSDVVGKVQAVRRDLRSWWARLTQVWRRSR
jgi:hypothetical protein